jgi:hypothetical protein
MTVSFEEKLCKILVKNKVLKASEAKALVENFQGRSKEAFDNFLLTEGIIKKVDLLKALSELYKVPSFDVVGHFFKRDLLLQFPQNFLIRHGIIPLERDENILILIASRPDDQELLPELSEYVSYDLRFYVGIQRDIVDAVREFYEESPFTVDENLIDDSGSDEFYEDARLLEDVFNDSDDDDDNNDDDF